VKKKSMAPNQKKKKSKMGRPQEGQLQPNSGEKLGKSIREPGRREKTTTEEEDIRGDLNESVPRTRGWTHDSRQNPLLYLQAVGEPIAP